MCNHLPAHIIFLATLTQLPHSPDLTLCDSLTQNDPELSLETDLWSRSTAPMLRSPQEYAI